MRPTKITVDFEGGFRDGEVLRGDLTADSDSFERDEAWSIYNIVLREGCFVCPSDYFNQEWEKSGQEGKSLEEASDNLANQGHGLNHLYTVVEKLEVDDEVYLKLKHSLSPSQFRPS